MPYSWKAWISPYANIIAAREDNKNDPRLKNLVNALHSDQVLQAAKKIFGDGGYSSPEALNHSVVEL